MIEYINDYQNGITYHGSTYSGDDIVVAEGEIGRIISFDEERELCCMAMSIYQTDPHSINHFSVCTMIGMRKANKRERMLFRKFQKKDNLFK